MLEEVEGSFSLIETFGFDLYRLRGALSSSCHESLGALDPRSRFSVSRR